MTNSRNIVVFSGGSAANSLVDVFASVARTKNCSLSFVLPISDNGGSSSELIRVFGGPGIGDVRSKLSFFRSAVFIAENYSKYSWRPSGGAFGPSHVRCDIITEKYHPPHTHTHRYIHYSISFLMAEYKKHLTHSDVCVSVFEYTVWL